MDLDFPKTYRGRLVLVTFWSMTCPNCEAEIPYWRDLYAKRHADGVEILGISSDKKFGETAETVRAFAQANGMVWDIVLQENDELSRAFRTNKLPMAILVDADAEQILIGGQRLRGAALAKVVADELAARQGAEPGQTAR